MIKNYKFVKLKVCIIFLLIVVHFLGVESSCTNGLGYMYRIIGGDSSKIDAYPYQLSVRYKDWHICGGVLIGQNYALSAAHCFDEQGDYSVRAGSSFKDSGGIINHVTTVFVHPKRGEARFSYDIAILKLRNSFTYSSTICPIKLPEPNTEALKIGITGTISGFGDTRENSQLGSTVLRATTIQIIDFNKCSNNYRRYNMILDSHVFCGESLGKDSCQGDSGGPFVVDGVLYGLVSFGLGCGNSVFPGVYINVAYFRDFIKLNSKI
ncbi:trypsin-1-like [Anthonomus grandis grandis]|uniref:trypsin-1-like n=1 Tax=Anthonomus grandis grandis TaxID=2921223 RepID=UPI002165F58A|nr:trypsin-1-like [Anthonomus grandis grandis]